MSAEHQDHPATENYSEQEQLEKLRDVILGSNHQLITDAIREHARDLVSDVLSEAIHDRQRQDGSVNKVLIPIVESAVDTSVNNRSEKMVSSLYPLVGSLVRKSVSSFLTDFMEKTNQLLENSLTIKGLKWRFKAWQSGVSFAQYVASQTFVYRVEHVLLIHHETGLLLKSVMQGTQSSTDADLISSMLSAINDFVGDSFTTNEDGVKEDLNTVTTDSFNLLIKSGPQALIVAAVTGHPPQSLADSLQITLEDIHKLYEKELSDYDGNNAPFENAEQLLRECLLSEQKQEHENKNTWMAWLLVCIIGFFGLYACYQWWQEKQLIQVLKTIDAEPGIVLYKISETDGIHLYILRDPDAISANQWLQQQKLESKPIAVHESGYQSLDDQIIRIRVSRYLETYPEIQHRWQQDTLYLQGSVSPLLKSVLTRDINKLGLNSPEKINTEQLLDDKLSTQLLEHRTTRQEVFGQARGKISSLQLDFAKGSDQLTPAMLGVLEQLVIFFQQIKDMSVDLNVDVGLLIIGFSDNSGSKLLNDSLSLKRATNTQKALQAMGIPEQEMYTSGLGQIDLPAVGEASRKVLFNILYIDSAPQETKGNIP